MLVLKRKIGESIMIGDDIELVILEQDGEAVRIGIKAPKAVSVFRKEIYEEIKTANQGATMAPNLTELAAQFRELSRKER